MSPAVISGRCACGKVTWSSTAAPQNLDFCYCITCQQASGAPFTPWLGVYQAALVWHGAISAWRPAIGDEDTSVSERTFCAACGSCLGLQYDLTPEKAHVAAGTVDQGAYTIPPLLEHIWVKRAPAWYRIPDDGVPRYQEFDDDFEAVLAEQRKKQK